MKDEKNEQEVKNNGVNRIRNVSKGKWIKFFIVAILYILFVIWDQNFWLLLGLPVIFDIYISKIIPWGAWKKSKNKQVRKVAEWTDAIVFALIAVYFINIFLFQNYKIPSSSLEKTLLVGDYLFVSKVSYGPRVPNTPLSFPLAQHTLPILNCKSYLDWPQWDYKRLTGFGEVKRNDIVVFNFPAGDTVPLLVPNPDYYSLCKEAEPYGGRDLIINNEARFGKVVYRPVDRRENYVKRCIGMPGDSLQIINNDVYINGMKTQEPKKMQLCYFVETNGQRLTEDQFRTLDVSKEDRGFVTNPDFLESIGITSVGEGRYNPVYHLPLTRDAHRILSRSGWSKQIIVEPDYHGGYTYPLDYDTGWTRDNYGPIWIPQKGTTIVLNKLSLALYSRCIENYEGNKMKIDGNRIFINGQEANSYTFKYNYYFMMGDNRHKSADSRSWGFVPEDHVVGKPILIWLSMDKDRSLFDGGIRWSRLFRFVDND